jgi:AcrR family transcriptional regulator
MSHAKEKRHMPRARATDYDAKAQAILDSAAALFAKEGYPGAKMQDVARACGATKSMLYHYFPTKDELLFAMLEEHLEKVIAGIEDVSAQTGSAEDRFAALVVVYVQKSAQSRRRHTIAQNDVKYLPKAMQAPLFALEKRVCDLIAGQLRLLKPGLPANSYKPYAMLLIGMLNGTDVWFKGSGEIKMPELCERISRLFLRGFMAEKSTAAPAS